MRVAIDIIRMHNFSQTRGIGIYAKNLYASLKKYTNLDVQLIEEKKNLENFNLVHFPFFDFFSHTLSGNFKTPFLVTIHDLIPIMFSKKYPPGFKGRINWELQKIALKKASSVIAVSRSVKEDIVNILKFPADQISVVYSAPSESFKKITNGKLLGETKQKYNLPDRFVLYIGNVNWNKNILNTTESVLNAGKNLVIIGSAFLDKKNLNHPEKNSFKEWLQRYDGNEKIKVLDFVEEKEIVKIMNLAVCLIFVSYYEGFGLPILEAQASNLPVITSNISATKEIAGSGALLVNPISIIQITDAVRDIFESNNLREKLIKKGQENVEKFSWKKTAIETLKAYNDVLL